MKKLLRGFLNECQGLIQSPDAILVMIAGVIFYSLLYPQSCITQVLTDVPVAIVDQDKSALSRTLARMIDEAYGTEVEKVYPEPEDALESLRRGEVFGVLIIPSDFSRSLLKVSSTTLPLYADAAHLLPYRLVYQSIRQSVELVGAGVRIQALEKKGIPANTALDMQNRGRPKIWTLYNPVGNYVLNTIPPVFILILHQTLLIGAGILTSRLFSTANGARQNTFPFLLGRLLFYFCLYSLYTFYYMWILPLFYDLPRAADLGKILLFFFPFYMAAASAGNILGRFLPTPTSVMIAIFPTSMPLIFLSGFVWPIESMPVSMQVLSAFLPTTPAINGYMYMVVHGASFSEILPLWYQLWGLFLFYFALARICAKIPLQQIRDKLTARLTEQKKRSGLESRP